jgi:polysaccharide chain length determinant protein (PEP-CTERM system associated)
MEEPRFDPLDYVSVFNRRKWWFIVPMALAVVIGIALVSILPREYQATATIGVSAARVAPNLVGAAPLDKQDRVRALSQQLLSAPVLEQVAREEHLDAHQPLAAVVDRLRSRIQVALPESITPGTPGALTPDARADLDSYLVTYTDNTPRDAQRIVNRIVNVFVQANNQSRELRAQDTSAFIQSQLDASGTRLNALEAELRRTKESYMGRLPEQTNANLAMVTGLQRQLEANATTLRGEQDRLSMIERQIESLEQGTGDALGAAAGTPLQSAQQRVDTLRRQLADARLTFTDKHPEVVRLKQELADAEQAAAAARTQPPADLLATLRGNPEYRQLQKDREATKLRIADLQRTQTQITGSIKQYQARVEEAPRVEQQLVSLERAYNLERETYSNLAQKKQAALLAEDLARKQGGEQFAVLVAAGLPSEPIRPKPLRVMLMALAAGFVLGGAGVVAREYLDRSVHDARGLRDEFELPVLAEIPHIEAV